MKKKIMKALSVMLAVVLTFTAAPLSGLVGLELPEWLDFSITSKAATFSGKCGENLIWTYDEVTETIIFSGSGEMYNYRQGDFPWVTYAYKAKILKIEAGVTKLADGALSHFDYLTTIIVDANNQYYTSENDKVLFNKDKSVLVSYPAGASAISYEIPNTVSSINAYAFYDCGNLKTITISENLMSIGSCAFRLCNKITDFYYIGTEEQWNDISIENFNEPLYIANKQFYQINDDIVTGMCGDNVKWALNISLGKLTISGSGTMNNYYAYNSPWETYEEKIVSVFINDGVTTIGNNTFRECKNLTSIIIPNSVISIGKYTFFGCEKLSNVLFGENLETIDDYAFCDCINLDNVIFNDKLISIGDAAFDYCIKLEKIIIPDSVTTIGNSAFMYCSNLKDLIIGDGVITIGPWAFKWCSNLRSVVIGDGVTKIDGYAFEDCENLVSVIFGESIKEIGCSAFGGCYKLTSINIPNSLSKIDNRAFNYCTSLTDIYYMGTEEEWKDISIGDKNDPILKATIHFNSCKHNYIQDVTVPTCIEQGFTTYTCLACGDTYIDDYVEALGHIDGNIVEENYIAPTCTKTGSKDNVTYCMECNAETSRETISIPALGHDIITDEALAPDCISTGLTTGEHCSRCDYKVEQTVIDALGHKYESVVTAPTCTSQGFTTYTCHCGDTYIGDYVDASGHNYKDGICTDCDTPDPSYVTFEIQKPSTTTIRCKDGIKLHAKTTGKLPDSARIEWSANNSNFDVNTSASGNEITIISKNNGYTTFTATVYDAENNVIAQDTIEMYSKAGLFDKIGGFFRGLFGLTKIYEN